MQRVRVGGCVVAFVAGLPRCACGRWGDRDLADRVGRACARACAKTTAESAFDGADVAFFAIIQNAALFVEF